MQALQYEPEVWRDDAACSRLGVPLEVFFSEDLGDIAQAKRICAGCPALASCLEGAIQRREPWGVWGGQLFLNGRMLATKRRRGRPPEGGPSRRPAPRGADPGPPPGRTQVGLRRRKPSRRRCSTIRSAHGEHKPPRPGPG